MHLITLYDTKLGIRTPFSAQEKVQNVKCLAGCWGEEGEGDSGVSNGLIHKPNKTNIINIMFKSFINIDLQTISIIIIHSSTVATNRAFFSLEW